MNKSGMSLGCKLGGSYCDLFIAEDNSIAIALTKRLAFVL